MTAREYVLRVRMADKELEIVDAVAESLQRNRSDAVRRILAVAMDRAVKQMVAEDKHVADDVPAAVTITPEPTFSDAGWSFTPSEPGLARLDEIASRESCPREEAARRVFKYGAWKMPAGFRG